MASKSFADLVAWQRAMDLAVAVYQATEVLPREEQYGLKAQLRRSASSIPANIAEGQGRRSSREFRRFLLIALGSNAELHTHVLLAQRLEMFDGATVTALTRASDEVGRLVSGLVNSLATAAIPEEEWPGD